MHGCGGGIHKTQKCKYMMEKLCMDFQNLCIKILFFYELFEVAPSHLGSASHPDSERGLRGMIV